MERTPQELMNQWRHKDAGDTPFFINFQNSIMNPRDEGFTDMLEYTCLPTFKLKSMTFVLMVVNTFYYIISLVYGLKVGGELLEPTQSSLFSLGMCYAYFIKYSIEYQRLLLSILLYSNFVNYLSCQFAIAIYGSYVEKLLGWKKLWMIGIAGGLGGTLLSCCLNSTAHVNGTSIPATYLGLLFGYLIMKWEQWNYPGSGRWQMMSWIIFGIGILIWQGKSQTLIDSEANLGSFYIGMLISLITVESLLRVKHNCLAAVGFLFLSVYFSGTIIYFFWYGKPELLPQ